MAELFTDLLIKVMIAVATPLVSAALVWLKYKKESLMAGLAKSEELRNCVDIVVNAMEEEFGKMCGEAKFAEAASRISQYAQRHHINVTDADIQTLIDAAVTSLRKSGVKEEKNE